MKLLTPIRQTVIVLLAAVLLLPGMAFGDNESVRLDPIQDVRRGEAIVIKGSMELPEAVVQIYRPNGSLLEMDLLDQAELSAGKKVTIPGDAPLGRYTVKVGAGEQLGQVTFAVLSSSGGQQMPDYPVVSQPQPTDTIKVAAGLVDESGTAAIIVSREQLLRAQAADGIVTIAVEPSAEAAAYRLELPGAALDESSQYALRIRTPWAVIDLPRSMLGDSIGSLSPNAAVQLTLALVEPAPLADKGYGKAAHRLAIELSLELDGKRVDWSGSAQSKVTVSLSYEPSPEERDNTGQLAVVAASPNGAFVPVINGRYEADMGHVRFSVSRLGVFAVIYAPNPFGDLSSYTWASQAIGELAARGIIAGTSPDTLTPAASIKRADFMLLLVRTLGLSAQAPGSFEDVEANAYYYEAIGIAKVLGITEGNGNNRFLPNKEISRQDMMTLTARALAIAGKLDPSAAAAELTRFADSDSVAPYAESSIALLVGSGLIQGDGQLLNPQRSTNRAEAAVLMHRLYSMFIHP